MPADRERSDLHGSERAGRGRAADQGAALPRPARPGGALGARHPGTNADRGYVETIFSINRLPLVAATLNNALGQALAAMASPAGQVRVLAATAQCPLPQAFEASTELVGELVNNPAQNVRLVAFRDQAHRPVTYATVLHVLDNVPA